MVASYQWYERRTRDPEVVYGSPVQLPRILDLAQSTQNRRLCWIDTPAHAEATAASAVDAADMVLIASRPSILDIQTLKHTARLVNTKPCGVVLTQCPARGRIVPEAQDIIRRLGLPITPILGHRVDFTRAINAGEGVSEFAPSSKAAGEIANLWQWIQARLYNKEDCDGARKG